MPLMRCVPYLILAAVAGACATPTDGGPDVPAPQSGVRRAALARVTVENHTDQPLSIAYRPATLPEREVVVGTVAPSATRAVAPVLAGEPIIFFARTSDGAEYAIPARSLDIDGEWLWVIPADATFVRGSGGPADK